MPASTFGCILRFKWVHTIAETEALQKGISPSKDPFKTLDPSQSQEPQGKDLSFRGCTSYRETLPSAPRCHVCFFWSETKMFSGMVNLRSCFFVAYQKKKITWWHFKLVLIQAILDYTYPYKSSSLADCFFYIEVIYHMHWCLFVALSEVHLLTCR